MPTVRKNRLSELRERAHLTQAEVAKLIDLDFTTVCRHETAGRGLTAGVIEKYARVYKVSSYELFLEPEPSEE